MQRYLGLSESEITENAKLWAEENDQPEMSTTGSQGLRGVGISPADIEGDIDIGGNLEIPGEGGGEDIAGEVTGTEAPSPEAPPTV